LHCLLNIAQTRTVSHVCNIPNQFCKRFPPRNCVAVFVVKEYGRGVSTNMHGLYVCAELTDGVAFVVKRKCLKSSEW
jgi:hypothetical protein